MVGAVSGSGWINESLFVDWLHHFISYAKPSKVDSILLILNNHESHISLDAFSLCKEHGIIMLTLPPHTSHKLQPLDLTYFGPIKTAYNQECENHMADRFGQPITQYDIVEMFTNSFNRCSNLENAASGFRSAGIYPLRPIEFDSIQPYISQNTPQATINPTQNIHKNTQPPDNQVTDFHQISDAHNHADITQVHSLEDLGVQASDTGSVNLQSDDTRTHAVSLSEIVELPIIRPKITKRKIRKKKSTILTSTLIKDQLEEKENRTRAKAEEIKKANEKNAKKRISNKKNGVQ
ncbi:jg1082 [Pararge aegeria aegeria]|uniref:Jg1082 protein n=1 Tax=Pararge aegeria aegeria TaxID=348720 RepID=A0A8S4QXC3_9NEOP|nr:jg1082 [Pararge aegeria aegeria]